MKYNVTGSGVSVTPEVQVYVEKRLRHIEKVAGDHEQEVMTSVDLRYSSGAAGAQYEVSCHVAQGSDVFKAQATGKTLHEAIDKAVGELNATITNKKQKRLHAVRRYAGEIKEWLKTGVRSGGF